MEYELIRSDRRTLALEIKQGRLLVRAPRRVSEAQIRAFVAGHEDWIKKHLAIVRERQEEMGDVPKLTMDQLRQLADRAAELIPKRAAYYAPLIGVRYGRITIRCQRTKWGSCSGKGNLNFNCLLMLAPPKVIDSVVVHELCHLKEMNHSDRFYAQVLRVFPDYKKWHKWLKDNGPRLMDLLPGKES